ncbi:glycoside hydrolase family 5 protein [Microbulbifer rhizosphaerae]|uniref:Aryl-phospho-beta-D-glucosidase BglC (GH1 family) n=1 Tax=Microbulbifer rhizosphaerae TaxID=1562603 RepID=A0A7W4WDY3_9GAMM|nr:cellulase family glycosylhydrolase [Microbulbifer rhizosphaerae]MBB3062478.1 aryl-phospho-beta-D-glucosidase BglC (GH1 family) [Microbulbifer rhizosphaerae]
MKIVILIIMLITPTTFLLAEESVNSKLTFWKVQRKGANGDGGANKDAETTPDAWFKAAAEANLEYIRLIPQHWPSAGRDFLLGTADNFQGIPKEDLDYLLSILNAAQRHRVKVLFTMFSLPGARNRQDNDYKFDYRLWNEEKFQQQALAFWHELANALQNHPAVVGYNPINEPHPSRQFGLLDNKIQPQAFAQWVQENKGTTLDLNRFNRRVVDTIRKVDPITPIVLDGWMHSSVEGLTFLDPVDDPAVLYAFHSYSPWVYATYRINKGRFSYPDAMPVRDDINSNETERWARATIHQGIQPVAEWARRHRVPANRIIAEELGADRRVGGVIAFLSDTLEYIDSQNWHWAFYSFRSTDWDGLDYELGMEKLGWKYWQQREQGKTHEELIQRRDNPLWNVFKSRLNKKNR